MYVPRFNVMQADAVREFVSDVGAAQLVTVGRDGAPQATQVPILWHADVVETHLALQNPHVEHLQDGQEALLIVAGPQAYVTPRWYAAKERHGRVVPTWNYSTVQLRGTVTVKRDLEWLRRSVTRLSDAHESHETQPWGVDEAPEAFIDGQLRGVVGVEIAVTEVYAKDKLSQNKSATDRAAVMDGLAARGGESAAVADRMRSHEEETHRGRSERGDN